LERSDALGEIVAQKDEFISYFMGLLGASASSHPETYKLMHMANLFASFMAMHYKAEYNRQRPSHLEPRLLPPLSVPGHASYPSGHSAQAHLIAKCASLLIPQGRPDRNKHIIDLWALAKRIARNREIAGLHYHTDTIKGHDLAIGIFNFIQNDASSANPQIPCYARVVEASQREWQ
jgi:hypothetical protein